MNKELELLKENLKQYDINLINGFNEYEMRMYHDSSDDAIGVIGTYHGEVTYTPTMVNTFDLNTRLSIYQCIEEYQNSFEVE